MATRRALVTGGAGFLGSHLCDTLLGQGYSVAAFDNLLTGRLANIGHLRNDSRFEFVEQDVCDPIECGAVDYVFHFASPASPVDYAAHGIETLRVGSYGTFESLETARRYGAKFMMRQRRSATAIRRYIRRLNRIGDMQTRSGRGRSATKPNVSRKRSPWRTSAITRSTRRFCAFSTATDRACRSTTGG